MNSQIYSQSLLLKNSNLKFYRVTDLQDVLALKTSHPEAKIVVGNTEYKTFISKGIETKFKNQHYPTIICPIDIPTLTEIEVKDDYINIGAAVTLSDLELSLRKFVEELPGNCVGGNIMTGSPISDLNPIFMAAEAKLLLMSADSRREVSFDDKFYTGYRRNIAKPEEVLVSVKIPLTSENTFFKTFKQSRRRDDDIAIVNAAMKVTIDIKSLRIDKMLLAFGGMAPTTVLASQTMKKLEGSTWDESITENALNYLSEELKLDRGAPGGMVDYRLTLTISFFFKFYLYVCQEIHDITHNNVRSLSKEEKALIKPYKNIPTKSVQFFDEAKEANKTGVIVRDEEVFASKEVHCVGQIIGLVLATNRQLAQKVAKMVEIKYEELPNPIFTIEDAINANSLWDPLIIEDGNIEKGFSDSKHVLEGEIHIGGQEHFYLETNVHIVIPKEDDEIELISSTQGASDLQTLVARTLGIRSNRVYCKVKRIGGGFGGKQSRSILVAIPLAVAASKMKRPVRLLLERDEDMVITGGRNPFLAKWKVGFDDNGKILALNTEFYANAGYCLDLSEAVIMKAVFNVNNVYKIPNLRVKGQCCKTNLPSNTAFRGFGNPQAVFVMENIVTDICNYLHLSQTKVREVNMYDKSTQVTHFGQEITKNCVRECWKQVCKQSDYEKRLSFVEKFNSENIYKKRGISVIPLKFGVSYEVSFLNQSGALVLVYADGSVLLSHGGMEMGQGLHTKMLQIASRVLEIPIEDIYIAETSTDKVPNTTPTAASVSSDLNGMAILYACKKILKRIQPYKEKMADKSWKDWINAAFMDRVSLSATGFYKVHGQQNKRFFCKLPQSHKNLSYHVDLNALVPFLQTCIWVLRTDIVMDVGKSLNPAIDIGQIEGAFMQGYGLFTLEQLLYTSSGELLTKGPGTYKIPTYMYAGTHDIPREFNVTLLRESSNDRAVYSSKAVGEPPLLSAVSVFLAIKMAVKSTRKEEVFPFDSPATSERIRMACRDWITSKIKFPTNGPFVPWSMEV
ncbi:Xanthine dehydrogenase [Armadillidium nasatum]|uniref:xanthine dehydrogenase n=1 Tax=Armadillidium nasatum TaxID=96803 RepID=A0A5N5TGV7_9CRUS|nr:Xanthine dehydrogenase [Armadillidium nasatum]